MKYYTAKTAARLICSMFAATKNDTREATSHAWITRAGKMYACDGFRAYRLNSPVAGVPEMDAAKAFDIDRFFPDHPEKTIPLELPTVAELRAMIAEDKRKRKRGEPLQSVFTFGTGEHCEQLPAVHAPYLADMLTMYPDARAYCTDCISPIIFTAADGDGLILPIRPAGLVSIDITQRRQAPAPTKKTTPGIGLYTFAALHA